jgi:hypothetical protein
MPMILCGEIMIPLDRFPQLPYWFTLRQAMVELDRLAHSEAQLDCPSRVVLVFSAQNQLLGVLRQQDILRGLKPKILAETARNHAERMFDVKVDPNLYKFYGGENAAAMLQEQVARPIGDFVRPIEAMLNYDDNLWQAIGLMIDHGLDLIPVLRDGHVAGLVTMLDVLQQTTKLLA